MLVLGNKGNGSLGDCLWLTSVLRYIKDVKILLNDDDQLRWVGRIFENLCEVDYVNDPPARPDTKVDLNVEPYLSSHRSLKILKSLGIDEKVCIPILKLTKEEKEWAQNFYKEYKNPIVVVNDNSGNWDKTNYRAHYVKPPTDVMQKIVYDLIESGFTPIQFGRSEENKFTPLDKTIHVRGLNVRELAASYNFINKYIGGDTGDYHLMLAVGGYAKVLIPKENKSFGYDYNDLLYKKENFENSQSRVEYLQF